MIHNESVNVWSHIFGVLLFIGLIGYTIVYLAPPKMGGTILDDIRYSWFNDVRLTKDSVLGENFP